MWGESVPGCPSFTVLLWTSYPQIASVVCEAPTDTAGLVPGGSDDPEDAVVREAVLLHPPQLLTAVGAFSTLDSEKQAEVLKALEEAGFGQERA